MCGEAESFLFMNDIPVPLLSTKSQIIGDIENCLRFELSYKSYKIKSHEWGQTKHARSIHLSQIVSYLTPVSDPDLAPSPSPYGN